MKKITLNIVLGEIKWYISNVKDEVEMILAQNHITRISKYKRVLLQLKKAGLQYVFAKNLADASGLSAAQVRKDFSILDIKGQKKGGYEVDSLLQNLEFLIGIDELREVILVGYGRIGSALFNFPDFQGEKIKIKAAFDVNVNKFSPDAEVPILPLSDLDEFMKKNPINLAILAVPAAIAQQVADELIEKGIKGILNLTSRYIRTPSEVYVNHIDLTMALESVIFHTSKINKD